MLFLHDKTGHHIMVCPNCHESNHLSKAHSDDYHNRDLYVPGTETNEAYKEMWGHSPRKRQTHVFCDQCAHYGENPYHPYQECGLRSIDSDDVISKWTIPQCDYPEPCNCPDCKEHRSLDSWFN